MFTGLIEEIGKVASRTSTAGEARVRIECKAGVGRRVDHTARAPEGRAGQEPGGALVMGESIAIDGACLTVVAIHADGFEVDASAETLARTTLGSLAAGSHVNLERAMPLGARMGGHLVTGHIDGTGALVKRSSDGQSSGTSVTMTFSFPKELARFIAEKGSICVSGISLTVNSVSADDTFSVTIIPHTLQMTTLGELKQGSRVNLEIDLVARYVLRAGDVATQTGGDDALDKALARSGYK